MNYCFILNPKSGNGKHYKKYEKKIRKACEKKGIKYEIHMTTGKGDAKNYVKEVCARGEFPVRFYACGGDGTLCEAVNGAAGIEGAAVGIVPLGTGNDFVRNFTPEENFLDIEKQIDGTERKIDLLTCNNIYCANMINIGFDCEVVKKAFEYKKYKFIPRKLAYVAGVIKTLIRKPGICGKVSVDHGEFCDRKYLLTTFANGAYCGGGFKSNPLSSLRDGCVDSLFVKDISRKKFVKFVGKYKKGNHLTGKMDEMFSYGKYKNIVIEFESPQNVSIDGEISPFEKVEITAVPRAVSFILPADTKRKI